MKKLMILFFILLFSSCVKQSGKTIKLSLILSDTSSWYAGAKKWQELLEQSSGGELKIQIYPNAQLASANQRTELEMVQSGVIDVSLESTILLSLIDQKFSVFSLPFLFQDYQEAFAKADSKAGEELLKILPENNLVGLAYGVNGFRQLTCSREKISDLVGLKNLKVRVPAISMYIDIFKQFEADPSSMNFGELFTSLAQKTMDAQENPLHVIHSAKLYEVQKYLFMWNYSYDPVIVCMNKKKWESFTPAEQKILQKTAREAFEFQQKMVVEQEKELKKTLQEKGMIISEIDKSTLQEFKKASQPVYIKYENIITKELIDLFRN